MVEHSAGTASSTTQARSEHGPGPWPTVEEAAELVGRQASTLRRRHDRGNLPGRLEVRDGRQVVTLDPAVLAAEYEHAAGTLQARFGHASGTPEHTSAHADEHGSGHGTATPPPASGPGGGHGTPPPPGAADGSQRDGWREVGAEPKRDGAAQDPGEPATGQALQVAGALLLRLRAEVAEEVDRAHDRADRLERQAERSRRAAAVGWGTAALAVVLAVAGIGWRTVEAREVQLDAQRQVGEAKGETLEALRSAQAREQQLEERHAAELQSVQQDAALKAREVGASAWAAGIGLRALGMR